MAYTQLRITLGAFLVLFATNQLAAQPLLFDFTSDAFKSGADSLSAMATVKPEENRIPTVDDFYYQPEEVSGDREGGVFDKIARNPGLSFLSSALLPGAGQAVNKKWVRAGLYLAAEAVAVSIYAINVSQAPTQEERYERFVNENWSVVNYAQWLIDYKNYHEGTNLSYDAVAQNPGDLDRPADYQNRTDWRRVNRERLNELEYDTRVCSSQGSCTATFSHVVPEFGSQQYYELASKYVQFGPGWREFYNGISYNQRATTASLYDNVLNFESMPSMWLRGAALADEFNDSYRLASTMGSILILNHVISAFDALFTSKLANYRLQTSAAVQPNGNPEIRLTYRF